mgnify:CR=1 FL=1|tara:strand:- start:48743 stop:51043 length:2301 start_codon:yes stop_codon:yes gene_type:complete
MEFLRKEKLSKLIIENRFLFIILSLVLVLILGRGVTGVTFDPDMDRFFPSDHFATSLNKEIDETFIRTDNIVIAINAKNNSIFSKRTLALIERLTEKSWTVPYSIRVDSLTNYSYVRSVDDDLLVEPFIENALSLEKNFIKERERIVEEQDIIFGSLISKDKKTTVISVIVDPPNPDSTVKLIDTIEYMLEYLEEAKLNHPELDIRILGTPYQEYISPKMVLSEMPIVMPLMLLLILVSVYFLLRSIYAVLATVLVILLSLISTFGAVGYIGNALNQMVITIPILIITLALADCVHLFSIFFQQMLKGHSSKKSMLKSLELNLQPLFLTTITTCIGFLSFNVLDIGPLEDLGNFVSIGIGTAFIFTIFFAAPLFSLFEIKPPKSVNQQVNLSRKIAKFSLSNSRTLLWSVPVFCFLLISLIPLNVLDENPTQMYDDGFTSFSKDTLWLDEMLGVTFPVSFKADSRGGSVSDPEFLTTIDNFTKWLESQNEVNHVTSLAHTMKNLNKSMNGDNPEWKRIPQSKELSSQYLFFYEMSLPMGLDLNSLVSQDRSSTKISASLKEMGGTEFLEFDKKIRSHLSVNNLTEVISPAAGFRVIFSHMSWVIVTSLFFGVLLGLFLISTLLGLFFRSVTFGILSVFPNVLPIGAAFGIWALYDGQVGFMVAVGMGSTLGIIVDFTVHLLSKYDLARREMGKNPEEAVMFAFESVGFALIVMTIVISLGFLVLNLVNFMPLHDFARFSTISFIVALLIDFLLFPNLLVKFDKRKL